MKKWKEALNMVFIILSLHIHSSCDKKNYIKLDDQNVSFEIEIHSVENNHGTAILNNKYTIYAGTPILEKKSYPTWLKDKNPPIFGKKSTHYTPIIYDVPPPYKLYKNNGEKLIFVVKSNDTILFKISENLRDSINDPTFKDIFNRIFRD